MSDKMREALDIIPQTPFDDAALDHQELMAIARKVIAQVGQRGEVVGEIVGEFRDAGGWTPKINWQCSGDHPGIGTKLYTAQPAPAVPDELTPQQIASACFSFRHDYGLLPERERDMLAYQCREWWRAISKELNCPSRHPMVLAAAPEVQP